MKYQEVFCDFQKYLIIFQTVQFCGLYLTAKEIVDYQSQRDPFNISKNNFKENKDYYFKRTQEEILEEKEGDHRNTSEIPTVENFVGTTIKLLCNIPNSHRNIIWEKLDIFYPLAIGTYVFSPDRRIQIRQMSPTQGCLLVHNATVADAGIYTCRSRQKKPKSDKCSNMPECKNHKGNMDDDSEQKFRVKIFENMRQMNTQVDLMDQNYFGSNTKINVYGSQLAFYGLPFELVCRANYSSSEAKSNPNLQLEWYHNGMRMRSSDSAVLGTLISKRWIDSNLLESRLFINAATEHHSGKWFCVDRESIRQLKRPHAVLPSPDGYLQGNILQPSTIQKIPSLVYDEIFLQIIGYPNPQYADEEPSHVMTFQLSRNLIGFNRNAQNLTDKSRKKNLSLLTAAALHQTSSSSKLKLWGARTTSLILIYLLQKLVHD